MLALGLAKYVESERKKLVADSKYGAFLNKLLAFRGISTTYAQAIAKQVRLLNRFMVTGYIK